ncbi:hypothetical protein BSKO_02810 [Bryopsis sp. KO-2023]|nr:hypothetical protein BSKO_02810 [Bryopsis sp. KO-2023]
MSGWRPYLRSFPYEKTARSAREGATMSDHIRIEWDLPREILIEILRRLPVTSLARCSCVAPHWQEAIKRESSLKRKIDLERAWLHEPIEPLIHKGKKEFFIFCCAKMEDLIALGGYKRFTVFDFQRKEFVYDCEEIGSVFSLSFMDGILVTGDLLGNLCGWEKFTWKKLFCAPILDSAILSIADLGDNVAIGGKGGDLRIWKKGVWGLKGSLQGHEGDVTCLLPQSDNLLISGSGDGSIRIWNLDDNVCLRVICGQKWGVCSLSVSDGLIFCGAFDGNIRSWEFESGQHMQTFRGHKRYVTSVFVKGGRMFTGSYDKTIKIWDATKGECVRSFDCSHNRNQDDVRQRMHVLWVDDEKLVAVRGNWEIREWDFSKGL